MQTRSANVQTTYQGKNITTDLESYTNSFSYTDTASGESDSISLTLHDPQEEWLRNWFPQKGDTIQSTITVKNWQQEGDNSSLDCGSFLLDDVSASGAPNSLSIGAVSAPADEAFAATERTKNWEQVTIRQVAQEIAERSGLSLSYEGADITIKAKEQSGESDSAFLASLCEAYGLSLKIYSNRLVIFDREQYKQKPPVATLHVSDLSSWSYNTTLAGSYTGGEITYTVGSSEEELKYTIGDDTRLLKLNQKVDNQADAERQLKAALNKENHGMTTMSISTMGNTTLVASQTIQISGIGKPDGKYYIDKITHDLGGGYKCSYELSRVEQSF